MKSTILLILGLFLCLPLTAQNKDKNKIESLKIAFITNALNLSTSEAQKFWTIYNKYEAKSDIINTDMHCNIYDKLDIIETMSPSAAEELLEDYMELRQQEYEIREAFVADLEKVISAKQIMMLKKAEYDFHRKLLEKYRSGNKK